jgi:hypothetical protein
MVSESILMNPEAGRPTVELKVISVLVLVIVVARVNPTTEVCPLYR